MYHIRIDIYDDIFHFKGFLISENWITRYASSTAKIQMTTRAVTPNLSGLVAQQWGGRADGSV